MWKYGSLKLPNFLAIFSCRFSGLFKNFNKNVLEQPFKSIWVQSGQFIQASNFSQPLQLETLDFSLDQIGIE